MVIDCESCAVRFSACGDCVVGVLLGVPPGAPTVSLDAPERHALDVLAEQGLVPRLRLVATRPRRAHDDVREVGGDRDAG
ncbi:MAG: hypothetical protein QOH17_1874 [Pseudonocardiales bacterium]|jgi:hypothetical protein|nr:hypothetical protein [Pseudonocardiales bacterium]